MPPLGNNRDICAIVHCKPQPMLGICFAHYAHKGLIIMPLSIHYLDITYSCKILNHSIWYTVLKYKGVGEGQMGNLPGAS